MVRQQVSLNDLALLLPRQCVKYLSQLAPCLAKQHLAPPLGHKHHMILTVPTVFFFKQKTAYEIGLGIPAEPLFRSLSFISGRLATKSNQIKQLIRNGRSASLQRTFKKSFTSFSHSTRNKTRDGLIRVRNIRALNGRFNTSITHAYSIVIGSKHITLNATGGGFLTASKQFRHGATSKSRSNTASNSTKHKSPHLSGWRQIISLIT